MKTIGLILFVVAAIVVTIQPKDTKKQDSKLLVEKKFDAAVGGHVRVEAPGADVIVTGTDNNEVTVRIFGTEQANDDHTIQFEHESNSVKVKIERNANLLKTMFGSKNYSLKVEMRIPNRSDLSVETAGGDVKVTAVEGHGKLSTAGGDIFSEKCIGVLDCSTAGGDVKVRTFIGKLECSTAGGDIKAEASKGSLKASTAGGDVHLLARDCRIEASSIGGDISVDYYGENKGMDMSSTGGDIRIKAPANIKADLKFTSMGGDVVSNLAATKFKKKSMHSITAQINGGGEDIECSSTGGDIVITD